MQWALVHGFNLIYQFWIHTEAIDRMWRPIEAVMNTPSHHRVHHGSNKQYLDTNYAGIFIVWDRMFGTFEPEVERVTYGLTTNITSHNPFYVAYHEFVAIGRDVARASGWRERWQVTLRQAGLGAALTGARGIAHGAAPCCTTVQDRVILHRSREDVAAPLPARDGRIVRRTRGGHTG